MRKLHYTYLLKACFALLLLLTLAGCGETSMFGNLNIPAGESIYGAPLPHATSFYLDQAASTKPPTQQLNQLLAVQSLLQNGELVQAQELLRNIRLFNLPYGLIVQKLLLTARLDLVKNETGNAIRTLRQVKSTNSLQAKTQVQYRRLLAAAYSRSGQYIAAVQERIMLGQMLQDDTAIAQNQRAIWADLQKIPQAKLETLRNSSKTRYNKTLAGWVKLAYIAKAYANDSQQLVPAITQWRAQYPHHPASSMLPSSYADFNSVFSGERTKVALLLPLKGKLAPAAKAIRNGFMEAYYAGEERKPSKGEIKVYDTSNGNVASLYQQAVNSGSNIIVGPLNRRNVDTMVRMSNLNVPVLALNYSRSPYASNNHVIQFGLSPLDEAAQVAEKAWRDGRSRAIIITPKGQWGHNVAEVFAERFKQAGGTVVGQLNYGGNSQQIAQSVRHILDVDESDARGEAIKQTLDEPVDFIPKRRQDVDMFFLVATPRKAQQIRPLLQFYYAGRIPVYATSAIYSGIPMTADDRDLDGIIFCDIPWVLDNSSQATSLRRKIVKLWPNNYDHYMRLYALGMDAYKLSRNPQRLTDYAQFAVDGETGKLTMDNRYRISRGLEWAIMQRGKPDPL